MAVIIDEFQVVVEPPTPTERPPTAPVPATPTEGLKPQDLREVLKKLEARRRRLIAH